ncbi:copper resistance protein NlpE N-terminal domain-containing protein [Hymenobacter psychrotolerans]|uniref:NlpE N-terminal domain-containing protein n=1 Tax=Hymenobacter psychrotolerans DSM 18569 TaxID=1121959 RepID=A0A1M6WA46_9BACT|nr:copper resistance protein NlpE N-terminal domain-containing protein [Hymenobacter psychrotolerans]SHK90642.1 NlpE N-terminal domain-containing protein [Hymenobacter psychrotolerans DSM 18569]
MMYRFFWLLLAGLLLSAPAATAQRKAPATTTPKLAPSFFSTYSYLTYAILDKATSPTPMAAKGVGGTLTLRPDGTYQKALTMAGKGGTLRFDQAGRFTFSADRITFSYTDKKGQPRTDEGTFRLANGLLTLTIQGYPAGNQSIYTLRAE